MPYTITDVQSSNQSTVRPSSAESLTCCTGINQDKLIIIIIMFIFQVITTVVLFNCRCWNAYSKEGLGSQVHVAVVLILHSLENIFYEGWARAAGSPPPWYESKRNWTELKPAVQIKKETTFAVYPTNCSPHRCGYIPQAKRITGLKQNPLTEHSH